MFYCLDLKKMLNRLMTVIFVLSIVAVSARYFVLPRIFGRGNRELVEKYAKEYELEESVVYAVIYAESGFDSNALSPKGAKGLMQITDRTGEWGAEETGIENFETNMLFDPETNIHIGCWYLSVLLKQYDYKLDTALAAYNAGSGNVSRWLYDVEYSSDLMTLDKIPFEETRKYILKVNAVKKIYDFLY
ncbi:MAG: lytic transglycosylase domain-containing protein [Firmicutes bacterium]|nr:lytic transglycosylase domain-containing protein [Bacillota bacterium]